MALTRNKHVVMVGELDVELVIASQVISEEARGSRMTGWWREC